MKQYDLINKVIDILVNNEYIQYAFLKGSFASGKEDVYSNVDIFIKLRVEKEEDFFANFLQLFETYNQIVFYKQYEYEKIRIIYKDSINLNINLVNELKYLKFDDSIVKLYDPDNLLDNIYEYTLELSDTEIASIVDEMSLKCYEFHRLFLRNEFTVIMHTVEGIHELYSLILHYYYSKEDSKLGIKKVFTNMELEGRKRYVEILKEWKLDSVKHCVLMMMEDVHNIIIGFNLNIANHFNFDFFMDMKKKISLL